MYNSFIFLNKMPKNLLILTSQYSTFYYILPKLQFTEENYIQTFTFYIFIKFLIYIY